MNNIYFYNDEKIIDFMIEISKEKHLKGIKFVGAIISAYKSAIYLNEDYSIKKTKSWAEICIETAQNIWSKNKPITLFWSGGIDSTCALVALMMTNPNWKDQIKIVTSNFSITREYPWFYEKYLKSANLHIFKNLEIYNEKIYKEDHTFVSGWCHPHDLAPEMVFSDELLNSKYQNLFNKNIMDKELFQKPIEITNDCIEYVISKIEKFPIKITTVKDLLMMLGFTHKYNILKFTHMSFVKNPIHFNKMTCFFETEDFKYWILNNFHSDHVVSKEQNLKEVSKEISKEFIFSYTKDEKYKLTKKALASLQYSIGQENIANRRYFILNNLFTVNTPDSEIKKYLTTLNI